MIMKTDLLEWEMDIMDVVVVSCWALQGYGQALLEE